MKKISIIAASILSALVVTTSSVSAAQPKVLSFSAEMSDKTISYNGKMEDGSYAVLCILYDKDDTEVTRKSSAVTTEHTFSDSITVLADGKYTVSCANYEGGAVAKATVGDEEEPKNRKSGNPDTHDSGIGGYTTILICSAAGILVSLAALAKMKSKKNA